MSQNLFFMVFIIRNYKKEVFSNEKTNQKNYYNFYGCNTMYE